MRNHLLQQTDSEIAVEFHKVSYARKKETWNGTFWLGVPVQKCPLNLWIYQEILYEVRPDLIVECGTGDGDSALYLAYICGLLNRGTVVTIDMSVTRNCSNFQDRHQVTAAS